MKTITKLCVIDFDGTLVLSPLPTEGKQIWKNKTGKDWPHRGWWGKGESLDTNVFDIKLNTQVKEIYQEEIKNDSTLMVMLTGRLSKLSNEVENVIKLNEVTFDKYIYNNGGSTLDSKIRSLNQLLQEYPDVVDVLLNDDRLEHIPTFEQWGKEQCLSGRLKDFSINVVSSNNH